MNNFYISSIPKGGRVHFTGIGGISMSGLAEILMGQGFVITGSDITETHITGKLRGLGAVVHAEGHSAEYVSGADLVVYTAAVKEDNAELVRAADEIGGHLLGALMLARVDGKSPAEYLLPHAALCEQVRGAALDILSQEDGGLDHAMDTASGHYDEE